MNLKHVISAQQFDTKSLVSLFLLTDRIKLGRFNRKALSGKIMATLFYQPSTRTRLSFESAMLKLGGNYVSTENASEFSSAVKGETLEDTIRVINFYADVIVIRHPEHGSARLAADYSNIPVINAGDGIGEHPTQALLDLYTIFSKVKSQNFTITITGDLANYRPSHSLSYLLSLYPMIKIIYVSPKHLSMRQSLRSYLKNKKITFTETENFNEGISQADVIYQTRIPKEYLTRREYKKYAGKYILDKTKLKLVKKEAIILHPLPRVKEITAEIDKDPRAIYFQQAENGIYIRMALLLSLLGA